ncbi:hypothetical protein GCM10009090_35360 [[Pseudomonas] boreopolis]|uniref:Uncharacterized protein n=2 Tax=Xanthomonas boreopolis TaxID=86183 RepID=A0A919KKL1_9XANT|nr:hypothetical protein GCM10009090_35360 [[Pseudomonas] boreopolis]
MAATAASESRATKQTVEQTVIAEVNAGHNLYIVGKGTLRPIYYVPISYVNLASANNKSTYDIVRDNNLKAQIESKLGDLDIVRSIVKQDVLATMVNIMQVATNYVGLKEQARIVFRVVMNDGTYIDFFLNPLDTTADAQENTARTASGQLIPENSQQAVGSWTAQGSDNLGQMADHMGKIGASVEYVGEGNFVNSITCTPQRCIVERQIR